MKTNTTAQPPAAYEGVPRGSEMGAILYRGRTVEAVHYASVAVVNASGKITHYLGDPEQVTMMRSSIKPFQMVPLLTTGAADAYGYTNRNLSIMAGSHSGTDEHAALVAENLKTVGADPGHLRCGTHWPIGMQNKNQYPLHGEDKDPLRHNCSGKHSGFLALARYLGEPLDRYLDPESRTQQLVKHAVSEICEYPEGLMYTGIDGCSAPNFPLPLRNLALGFWKLANQRGTQEPVRSALARVRAAMMEHPVLYSGEGRLDYELMRSFPGNIVCKGGAEALQAIGFAEPSIGIAVKVHDGNWRALGVICFEVLRQLGLIKNPADFPLLKHYDRPEIRNCAGLLTGHTLPVFALKKAV